LKIPTHIFDFQEFLIFGFQELTIDDEMNNVTHKNNELKDIVPKMSHKLILMNLILY